MFTKLFWRDAAERSIATAAQAFAAVFGVGVFYDAIAFDWAYAGSITLGAAILSLVKALAAAKLTDNSVSPASLVSDGA